MIGATILIRKTCFNIIYEIITYSIEQKLI